MENAQKTVTMHKKYGTFFNKSTVACRDIMQKRTKMPKLCRHKKEKTQENERKRKPPAPRGADGGVRFWGMRTRWDCAKVRAQRSELVAALVLPVHCQLAISGRSTPCAAMYCRCSTSLSRICCTA